MQKLFGRVVYCLYIVLFLSSQPVYCAEQDPVKFITEFYAWYISAPNSTDLLNSKEINYFVAKDTLDEVRLIQDRHGFNRIDYFIKRSSGPGSMDGVTILVDPVESIAPDTSVAIVTIVHIGKSGHRFPDGVIVVVLKINEGLFKIFKCIDAYPEA